MKEQYVDGLLGPLIINPLNPVYKKNVDYVTDHAVQISDFYQFPAEFLRNWYLSLDNPDGTEPIPDAVFLNQQEDGGLTLPVATTQITRLRLINSAAYSMFIVGVDGLSLTVIEVDGTEVQPYVVSNVTVNVAQRVSVLIDWSKRSRDLLSQSSIYLRVTAVTANYPVDLTVYKPSYNPNFSNKNVARALFTFVDVTPNPASPIDAPNAIPQLLPSVPQPTDFNGLNFRPVRAVRAPDSQYQLNLTIVFQNDANGIFRPYINGAELDVPAIVAKTSSMLIDSINGADDPAYIAQFPFDNRYLQAAPNAPTSYIIPFGAVIDVLIINTGGEPHPVHYHGYTFWVVATSEDPDAETRNRDNYELRDTVTVVGPGWAKIRFVANNPGVWIMHCHYDWHMAAGFGVTLHVGVEQTRVLDIPPEHAANCCNYAKWQNPATTC
jgi:iron transport multicopper oxidase